MNFREIFPALALVCIAATWSPAGLAQSVSDDVESALQTSARAELANRLERAAERRTAAITGLVIGGVIIAGGVLATASSAETVYNEDTQQNETELEWAGAAIGAVVGGLVVGGSVSTLVSANRELRELRRQQRRLHIGYKPSTQSLVLAFHF